MTRMPYAGDGPLAGRLETKRVHTKGDGGLIKLGSVSGRGGPTGSKKPGLPAGWQAEACPTLASVFGEILRAEGSEQQTTEGDGLSYPKATGMEIVPQDC